MAVKRMDNVGIVVKDLDAFRKGGDPSGLVAAGSGPQGEPVLVAQPADALAARFRALHAQ